TSPPRFWRPSKIAQVSRSTAPRRPPHKRRKQQEEQSTTSATPTRNGPLLDEEHYFGMYVAAALRTFDALARDTAKVKIMDLIMHLRHNVDPNHRK
ncbi:hypothetical protein MTO96_036577, partial [Rhipicephalus appendiculatus]